MNSLSAGVADYLASLRVERGLARNTLAAYQRDLDEYLRYLDGRPADDQTVSSFVDHLVERGLAPASVSRKTAAVRGLHRYLAAEGLAATDPTALLERRRLPEALPKALVVEEAIKLVESPDIDTLAGRRDSALLEFLYGTGARVSEAVGLDLPDLDLVDRTALVTGKGSKQRLVPLGGAAVRSLERWLPDRLELTGTTTDAVFVNLRGRRISRQACFDIVRSAARRAGVEAAHISPHVLRHSAATHMIEGGADLRTVQEMLGHANVTTTQVYTRVSPQHLLEVFVQAHPRSR